MLAKAIIVPLTAPPHLSIEHKQQKLSFNLSRYTRKPFEKGDVFEYLNNYWADMPYQVQDELFEVYKQVAEFYDDHHTRIELRTFMTEKALQILTYHDLKHIDDWISFRSDIRIPEAFEANYVDDVDSNMTRDKTYTRVDYKQLIGLSLALHALVPIWSEYINIIRHETGNEHKEKHAFQLIHHSPIMASPAMVKLKHYVGALTVDKHTPDNILKGISSEDFVHWLVSLIAVKRLCIAHVQIQPDGANIITYIYKFIIQRLQAKDNGFENSYKEKKYDVKGPGGQENKISTLEKYKIKTSISPGEIVEIQYSIKDVFNVASRLTSRVTPEYVQEWLTSSTALLEHEIPDTHIAILAWVLKPVISPQGLHYLSKEALVELLGVAQAVLWARGYRYLALLLSCYAITSDHDMVVSPIDSKMRLSKEMIEQIEKIYPFNKPSAMKRKSDTRNNNIVLDTIDQLTDTVAMYGWRMTAPAVYIQQELNSSSRKFMIRPDIKTSLAELVISIGERSWI